MPPGRSEVRHHHLDSRQLFYVLSGVLTLEVEHHIYEVHSNEPIEVSPGQAHQVFNQSAADVTFLSVSQPPSQGDRVLD
jgi:mannose-6-phosphate isomerase-like protein (cupin superfamily)